MTLNADNVPPTTGFSISTSGLEDFLPGLVEAYGENMPMELFIYAKEAPKVIFAPDSMSGYISFAIEFRILNVETAATLTFMDGEATYELSLVDFLLYLHFDEIKLGDIYVE